MVVAFLAYARLDRTSVAMSMRETNARFSVEATQARVQAIMNSSITTGPASKLSVSVNKDGAWATSPGDHNATSLLGLKDKARPPVYVDSNGDGKYDEFQYFLNLNQDVDATGGVIYQPTTAEGIGDPHWIGVLEDSNRTHGPDNRFVARYAYLVVPTDEQLDINRVHNKDKNIIQADGFYSEGYQRRHGNACWEMNLAGGLAMLDPNTFSYTYIQQGDEPSEGGAFGYAGGPYALDSPFPGVYAGLWNYRYPGTIDISDLHAAGLNRTNQREFVDLLDFLREPGLRGDTSQEDNPSNHVEFFNYFTGGQSGRKFYDMLGAFTTHAAKAPTVHSAPQDMKPILGMPPTEKLLINEFFADADFSNPATPTSLNSFTLIANKFEVDEAAGTDVAEVIVFNEDHKLTMGQRVSFWVEYAAEVSTLYYYGTTPMLYPHNVRELYVEVLDSKRVTLWYEPIRPGDPILHPDDSQKVRFAASQPNGDGVVPVSDLSDYPEPLTFFFSYEPLAKKFTELASLMLQNAMVRTGGNFHIGSDPDLVLFDKVPADAPDFLREKAARYFGANNIQIYPPEENNFTPEVQRLLQVALNLTEVYSPNTGYDINADGINDLRLAWPLVFRPIISHEAGDKVYIAGWRRLGREEPGYWTNTPWWTYGYDLPGAPPLPSSISPTGWLGKLPDRPALAPDPNPKAPPVYGSEAAPIPLLIGVNKGTQAEVQGALKIWPSVNELSASIEWRVNYSTGAPTPILRVGVELRDNLYSTSLQLRLLVKGTISGNLNGVYFEQDLSKQWPLPTLLADKRIFLNRYPISSIDYATGTTLTPGITGNAWQRASWKVDNLALKADIVIVCTDPNFPARERMIDMTRVNFSAVVNPTTGLPVVDPATGLQVDLELPRQWKEWQNSFKYKFGDQVESGGKRYYAREDHESSVDFTLDAMKWKEAVWTEFETFNEDEVIRCSTTDGLRLYRCDIQHQSPGVLNLSQNVNGEPIWKPYIGEIYEMSWQVNDPLVNGMGRDYTLVHPLVPNNVHPLNPPYIKYLPLGAGETFSNNLGFDNYVYRPWNVADTSEYDPPIYTRPWADSYDFTSLKDPGVFSSQNWKFPHKDNLPAGSSAALETIGWLGLVHRGTPWQSVYLKSKPADRLLISSINAVSGVITAGSVPFFWKDDRVKLEGNQPQPSQPLYQDGDTGIGGYIRYDYSNPQMAPYTLTLWDGDFSTNLLEMYPEGYMHNDNDPASWLYLVSTYPWQRATGTKDTLPTNDHRLVDIFSTSHRVNNIYSASLTEAARTSLLSVNAEKPEAWAAVLSGVAVPLSKKTDGIEALLHRKHPGNCTEDDCIGFDLRLAPGQPGQPMRNLVKLINEHRVLHGGDQDIKRFERVSDLLSVPELTSSQPDYQDMIAQGDAERAALPNSPAEWVPYYPDELDYERIPQQILSLLRTDSTPRFVAYVFSQTLKPAKGSLNVAGHPGLCSNYAIDREAAQRTVFRMDGVEKWREYHYLKKSGLSPDKPPLPRVVIESNVPLSLR
jgi:hypothetical protein